MNNPLEHKQLLALIRGIGSPDELEDVLETLTAVARKTRDKISGKQAQSLAYWGAATRLTAAAKDELEAIRS